MLKGADVTIEDLEPMNKELSECLKAALLMKKDHFSEIFLIPSGITMEETQIIFDKPVLAPCYVLFGLADHLGVTKNIFEIITTYELYSK